MITVLFFAHLQDEAGVEKAKIDRAPIKVADLKKLLEEEYGVKLDTVMFAVNEEYAGMEEIVEDGDTVALIPPVSGG